MPQIGMGSCPCQLEDIPERLSVNPPATAFLANSDKFIAELVRDWHCGSGR